MLDAGVDEHPVQIVWVVLPSSKGPIEDLLRPRLPEYKLGSLEAVGQSDDERTKVVLLARRILIDFVHTPRTIRVDFIEFGSDGSVDQVRIGVYVSSLVHLVANVAGVTAQKTPGRATSTGT